MPLLPFNEWAESEEGASLSGLEQIQSYGDHYRYNSFAEGSYNEKDAADVDASLFTLARNRGLVDPEDDEVATTQFFDRPAPEGPTDEDLNRVVAKKFYNKEPGEAEVRNYIAAKNTPGMSEEMLAERRAAAEPFLTPEARDQAKEAAVLRGDAPFAVIKNEKGEGRLVVNPELGAPTDAMIAEYAKKNPDLVSSRDLAALRDEFSSPEGFTTPRHALRRNSELRKVLADGEVGEDVSGTVGQVAKLVSEGKLSQAREVARDLRYNEALSNQYSEEDMVNAAMDLAKKSTNSEAPQVLSTGEVAMPVASLTNKEVHDAMVDGMDISDAQKENTKKTRLAELEARAPMLHKLALGIGGDKYLEVYENGKAAGKSSGEIVEQWYSDPENYSGLKNRAKGVALGLADMVGFIAYPMAMAGDEDTRVMLASLAQSESNRTQYAGLFGDEFGIGYSILKTAPSVAADIALSIPTGGAVMAATAGTKFTFKQGMKLAFRSSMRDSTKVVTEQALKKGTAGSVTAALRATGDDVMASVGKFAHGAVALTPTTFTRAAGATYISAFDTLSEQHPEWSEAQVREAAYGHAVTQGMVTTGITVAFQGLAAIAPKYFGAGVEEWATGARSGLSVRQLNKAYSGLAKVPGKLPKELRGYMNLESFEGFVKGIVKEGTRNSLGAFGRQVLSEAAEEGIDQFVGAFLESNITKQDVDIMDALRQSLHAAVVGGAFGGAGAVKEVGLSSKLSARDARSFEQDAYTRLADGLSAAGDTQSAAFLRDQLQRATIQRRSVTADLEEIGNYAVGQEARLENVGPAAARKLRLTPSHVQGRLEQLAERIASLEETPPDKRTLAQMAELVGAQKLQEKYANLPDKYEPDTAERKPGALTDEAGAELPGLTDAGTASPKEAKPPKSQEAADKEVEAIQPEISRLEGYGENATPYQKERLESLIAQRNEIRGTFPEPSPPPTDREAFDALTVKIKTAEDLVRNIDTRFPNPKTRSPEVAAVRNKAAARLRKFRTERATIVDARLQRLAPAEIPAALRLPPEEKNEFGETQFTFGMERYDGDTNAMIREMSTDDVLKHTATAAKEHRATTAKASKKLKFGETLTPAEKKALATENIEDELRADVNTLFGLAALQEVDNTPSPFPSAPEPFFKLKVAELAQQVINIRYEATFANQVPAEAVAAASEAIEAEFEAAEAAEPGRTTIYVVPTTGREFTITETKPSEAAKPRNTKYTGFAVRDSSTPSELGVTSSTDSAGFGLTVTRYGVEEETFTYDTREDAIDAAEAKSKEDAGPKGKVVVKDDEASPKRKRQAKVADKPSVVVTPDEDEDTSAATGKKKSKSKSKSKPKPKGDEDSVDELTDEEQDSLQEELQEELKDKVRKATFAEIIRIKAEAAARGVSPTDVAAEKVAEEKATISVPDTIFPLLNVPLEEGEQVFYNSTLYRAKFDPKVAEVKRIKSDDGLRVLTLVSKKTGRPLKKQPLFVPVATEGVTLEGPDGTLNFLRAEDEAIFNQLLEDGNVPPIRAFAKPPFNLTSTSQFYTVPFRNTLEAKVAERWPEAKLPKGTVTKADPDPEQQAPEMAKSLRLVLTHRMDEGQVPYQLDNLNSTEAEINSLLAETETGEREAVVLIESLRRLTAAEDSLTEEDYMLLQGVEAHLELDALRAKVDRMTEKADKRVAILRERRATGAITELEFEEGVDFATHARDLLRARVELEELGLPPRPTSVWDMSITLRRLHEAQRAHDIVLRRLDDGDYGTKVLLQRLTDIQALKEDVRRGKAHVVEFAPGKALGRRQRAQADRLAKSNKRGTRLGKTRKIHRGNKTLNQELPFLVKTIGTGVTDPDTQEEYFEEVLEAVFTNNPFTTAAQISAGFPVKIPKKYLKNQDLLHPGIKLGADGFVASAFDPKTQKKVSRPGDLLGFATAEAFTPTGVTNSARDFPFGLPPVPESLFGVVGTTAQNQPGSEVAPGYGSEPTDAGFLEAALNRLEGIAGGTVKNVPRKRLEAERAEAQWAYKNAVLGILGTEARPGPLRYLRDLLERETRGELPEVPVSILTPALRAELEGLGTYLEGQSETVQISVTQAQALVESLTETLATIEAEVKAAEKEVTKQERANTKEQRLRSNRLVGMRTRVERLQAEAEVAAQTPEAEAAREAAAAKRAKQIKARDAANKKAEAAAALAPALTEAEEIARAEAAATRAYFSSPEGDAERAAAREADIEAARAAVLTPEEEAARAAEEEFNNAVAEVREASREVPEALLEARRTLRGLIGERTEAEANLRIAQEANTALQTDEQAALDRALRGKGVDEQTLKEKIEELENQLQFNKDLAADRAQKADDAYTKAVARGEKGLQKSPNIRDMERLARETNSDPDAAKELVRIQYITDLREFALAYRLAEMESRSDRDIIAFLEKNLSPENIMLLRKRAKRNVHATRVSSEEIIAFLKDADDIPARADTIRKFKLWVRGIETPDAISQEELTSFLENTVFDEGAMDSMKKWLDDRFIASVPQRAALVAYANKLIGDISPTPGKNGKAQRTRWYDPKTGEVRPRSLDHFVRAVSHRYVQALRNKTQPLESSMDDPAYDTAAEAAEAMGKAMSSLWGQSDDATTSMDYSSFFNAGARAIHTNPVVAEAVAELGDALGYTGLPPIEIWTRAHEILLQSNDFLSNVSPEVAAMIKNIYSASLPTGGLGAIAAEVAENVSDNQYMYARLLRGAGLESAVGVLHTKAERRSLIAVNDENVAILSPQQVHQLVEHIAKRPETDPRLRQIAQAILKTYAADVLPSMDFLSSNVGALAPWIGVYTDGSARATINLTKTDDNHADTIIRAVLQRVVSVHQKANPDSKMARAAVAIQEEINENFPEGGTRTVEGSIRFAMTDPLAQARMAAKKPKFMARLTRLIMDMLGLKGSVAYTRVARLVRATGAKVWGTDHLSRGEVRNTGAPLRMSVLEQARAALPMGVELRDSDAHTGLAWVTTTAPNAVYVNLEALSELVSGLSAKGQEQVINAVMNHELAHLASMQTLTDADRMEILTSISPRDLDRVLARVPETGGLIEIAEEYLRMKVEETTGRLDSDELVKSILTHGTGLRGQVVRYMQRFVGALRAAFGSKPSLQTLVHIDRVVSALDSIKRNGMPIAPIATTDVDGNLSAFEDMLSNGSERTFFAVPLMSTAQAVKDRMARINSAHKLYHEVRKLGTDAAGANNAYRGIVDDFMKKLDAARKAGVVIPAQLLNDAMGSQDAYVTETEQASLDAARAADVKAGLAPDVVQANAERRYNNMARVRIAAREAAQAIAMQRIRSIDTGVAAALENFRASITRASRKVGNIRGGNDKIVFDDRANVHLIRHYEFFNSPAYRAAVMSGAGLGTVKGYEDIDFNALKSAAIVDIKAWHQRTYGRAIDGKKAWSLLNGWLSNLARIEPKNLKKDDLKKVSGIFEGKEDYPAAVRALIGEETSAIKNGIYTHGMLTAYLAKHKLSEDLRPMLLTNGFAFTTEFGPDGVALEPLFARYKGDDEYPALQGLYAYPEDAKAIAETLKNVFPIGTEQATGLINGLTKGMGKFFGASMTMKTLFSVGFYPRNELSNSFFFRPMQGDWGAVFDVFGIGGMFGREASNASLAMGGIGMRTFVEGKEAETVRLLELNIIKDDVNANVMREIFATGTNSRELMEDVAAWESGNEPKSWIKKAAGSWGAKIAPGIGWKATPEALSKLNELIDAKAKIGLYYMELGVLKAIRAEINSNKTDAQLEKEAADKVHATMPGHSQVYKPIKDLTSSNLGLIIAPFARFKGESIRVFLATLPLGLAEIKEGRENGSGILQRRGYNRIASFMLVNSVYTFIFVNLVAQVFNLLGDDDEQGTFEKWEGEEGRVLRRGSPEWQKYHTVYGRKNKDGTMTTFDMTYINPMSLVTDPFNVFMDRLSTDGFGAASEAFVDTLRKDLVGSGIGFGALLDTVMNQDDFGQPLYLPTDQTHVKATRMLEHYWEQALKPGVWSKGSQALDAIRFGDKANDGERAYDLQNILVGEALGVRPRDILLDVVMEKGARSVTRELAGARDLLSPVFSPKYTTKAQIEDAYNKYEAAYLELWKEHRRNADGWAKLTGDESGRQKYLKAMVDGGQSKERSMKAINGGIVDRVSLSRQALEIMYRAGESDAAEGGEERVRALTEIALTRPRVIHIDD